MFGRLHRPQGGSPPRFGLVICKPFGREENCAHRSVRAFAKATTAIAIPSLVFDYSGHGFIKNLTRHYTHTAAKARACERNTVCP